MRELIGELGEAVQWDIDDRGLILNIEPDEDFYLASVYKLVLR